MNRMSSAAPEDERPVTPLIAAAWTLAVGIVTAVVLQVLTEVRGGSLEDLLTMALGLTISYVTVSAIFSRVHAPTRSLADVAALRGCRWADGLASICVGAAIALAVIWLDARLERWRPTDASELASIARMFDNSTPLRRAKIAASIVVLLPVVTEIFFRGLLLGGLLRTMRPWGAILVSSVVFSLTADSPRQIVFRLLAGSVFGVVRVATGSSVTATMAAMVYSLMPAIPLLRGQSIEVALTMHPVLRVAISAGAAVALVVFSRRVSRPQVSEVDAAHLDVIA